MEKVFNNWFRFKTNFGKKIGRDDRYPDGFFKKEFNGFKIADKAWENSDYYQNFWKIWSPGQDEFNLIKSATNKKRRADDEARSEPKRSAAADGY